MSWKTALVIQLSTGTPPGTLWGPRVGFYRFRVRFGSPLGIIVGCNFDVCFVICTIERKLCVLVEFCSGSWVEILLERDGQMW